MIDYKPVTLYYTLVAGHVTSIQVQGGTYHKRTGLKHGEFLASMSLPHYRCIQVQEFAEPHDHPKPFQPTIIRRRLNLRGRKL